MRIAYVSLDPGIPWGSQRGSAIHALEFTRALAELGHEVRVLAFSGDEKAAPPGVHVETLDTVVPETLVTAASHLQKDLFTNRLARRDVQILITMLIVAPIATARLRAYKPAAIIERYALFATAGTLTAKELGVPSVLEINAPLSVEATRWRDHQLFEFSSRLEEHIFRSASVRVTVSNALAAYVNARISEHQPTHVIPNGVDTALFSPDPNRGQRVRDRLGITPDCCVVGYIGGFRPWHDIESLVHGFQMFVRVEPNAKLLLVGECRQPAWLESLIHGHGIRHSVIETGSVNHDEMPGVLDAVDIAVVPLKPMDTDYFSPLKMFEYMAMERCILAADIGQIREILKHDSTAWLYEPGSPDSLAQGLVSLARNSPLRIRLGKATRNIACGNFTWRRCAELVEQLIRSARSET